MIDAIETSRLLLVPLGEWYVLALSPHFWFLFERGDIEGAAEFELLPRNIDEMPLPMTGGGVQITVQVVKAASENPEQ